MGPMGKPGWKELIVEGVGGFLLFLGAGYAALLDVISYMNGRPLISYTTKMNANNDFGIFLTLVLIALAALGLLSCIYQVHHALKKHRLGS